MGGGGINQQSIYFNWYPTDKVTEGTYLLTVTISKDKHKISLPAEITVNNKINQEEETTALFKGFTLGENGKLILSSKTNTANISLKFTEKNIDLHNSGYKIKEIKIEKRGTGIYSSHRWGLVRYINRPIPKILSATKLPSTLGTYTLYVGVGKQNSKKEKLIEQTCDIIITKPTKADFKKKKSRILYPLLLPLTY